MRIRLLTDRMCGGVYQEAGDELDLPTAEAERMVKFGQAEWLARPKQIETAAIDHTARERRGGLEKKTR